MDAVPKDAFAPSLPFDNFIDDKRDGNVGANIENSQADDSNATLLQDPQVELML